LAPFKEGRAAEWGDGSAAKSRSAEHRAAQRVDRRVLLRLGILFEDAGKGGEGEDLGLELRPERLGFRAQAGSEEGDLLTGQLRFVRLEPGAERRAY